MQSKYDQIGVELLEVTSLSNKLATVEIEHLKQVLVNVLLGVGGDGGRRWCIVRVLLNILGWCLLLFHLLTVQG